MVNSFIVNSLVICVSKDALGSCVSITQFFLQNTIIAHYWWLFVSVPQVPTCYKRIFLFIDPKSYLPSHVHGKRQFCSFSIATTVWVEESHERTWTKRRYKLQAPLSFIHCVSSEFFIPFWVGGWWHLCKKPEDKDSARMDSLAICSGEDKRLVVVPSFASVGIKHTWLLLKARSQLFEWQGLKEGFLQNLLICSYSSLHGFYWKLPFWMFLVRRQTRIHNIFCQQNTIGTKKHIFLIETL